MTVIATRQSRMAQANQDLNSLQPAGKLTLAGPRATFTAGNATCGTTFLISRIRN